MKIAIVMLTAVAGVSGCTSPGTPLFGSSQRFAYPAERAALSATQGRTATPRRATISTAPSTAAPLAPTSAEPPPLVDEATAPYDYTKDPHVTAVLLPPVQSEPFPESLGADGRSLRLPPPMKLDIINVSETSSVLTGANP